MYEAVRVRTIIPLAEDVAARGLDALCAPLQRINDGVILTQDGIIQAVEPFRDFIRRPAVPLAVPILDLGPVTIVPGLVNCHTHLELSLLHKKTLLGQGFLPWLKSLITAVKGFSASKAILPLETAFTQLSACGTSHVGDISSKIPYMLFQTAQHTQVQLTVFMEVMGYKPKQQSEIPEQFASCSYTPTAAFTIQRKFHASTSLAGHALYSTLPEALQQAQQWCAANGKVYSIHLAEHPDEIEMLTTGKGELAELNIGRMLPSNWQAPGCHPVEEAHRLGLLGPGTLAVHCVHCGPQEIDLLANSGSAVCLCPRSNHAIAVGGEAHAYDMAQAGALLCLGTDSLASNTNLNLWSEVRYLLQKNILPGNALLRMATRNGAFALGIESHTGALAKGKRFCYSILPGDLSTVIT